GETGHPRHQRSRRRQNPDRGRHPAGHQGRAAVDPRQRQDVKPGSTDMPAKDPTWTDERLELLKSGFAAGLTCRQIADDIGLSRNAVIGKLNRLNLTREKSDEVPRTRRKEPAKGRHRSSVPRLQYQLLQKLYAEPQPAADDAPIPNDH